MGGRRQERERERGKRRERGEAARETETHKVDAAQLLEHVEREPENRPASHAGSPNVDHRLELRLVRPGARRRDLEELAPLVGVIWGDEVVDDLPGLVGAALREEPPRRVGEEVGADGEGRGRDGLQDEGDAPAERIGDVDRPVTHKETCSDCGRRERERERERGRESAGRSAKVEQDERKRDAPAPVQNTCCKSSICDRRCLGEI